MEFSKKDAKMTKGLAIVCMVVLHLFCRTGSDVFGKPLIWLNKDTPFVYWFGFFAEICVPLYSMCAGYAQQHLYEAGRTGTKATIRRIARLMLNYYLVLGLFTMICLCIGNDHMPGSWSKLLKSLILLDSYNGAWWYLNTYILCLLIPASVILFPVRKMSIVSGVIGCWVLQIGVYLLNRFGLMPDAAMDGIAGFVIKEAKNLFNVLPYFWLGAFMCKGRVLARVRRWWKSQRYGGNAALLLMGVALFLMVNMIHKVVLVGVVAFATFLIFNLWEKGRNTERVFLFLGDHSTNIWLTHMFFYAYIFEGLVVKACYPIPMFLMMLTLCCFTSYIIKGIQCVIEKYIFSIR